jgi:hypothetical protein
VNWASIDIKIFGLDHEPTLSSPKSLVIRGFEDFFQAIILQQHLSIGHFGRTLEFTFIVLNHLTVDEYYKN